MGLISHYLAVGCNKIEQFLTFIKIMLAKNFKIALKEVKKLLKSIWQMLYTKKNNLDLEHDCDDEASIA